MKKTWFGLAVASLAMIGTASAGVITHNGTPDNSTTTSVIGITGFTTLGDQMTGMLISVVFDGGDTANCVWAATAPGAGGCNGVGGSAANTFSLVQSGDTFSQPWTLTAAGRLVTSLTIDALPGNTVFDWVGTDPVNSTPGSAEGVAVSGTTVGNFNGVGGYSNQIQIGVTPPVGDIYGVLRIDFNGGVGSASFLADTDTVGLPGGDIPEPSTYLMIAAGLGLVAWKRRR